MIKYFDFLSILVGAFLLLCVVVLFDWISSKPDFFVGKVVDKQYVAESGGVETGTVITNGKPGIVTTSSHEPEKFIVMIESNGEIFSAKCEPKLYYKKKIGDEIEFAIYKGMITGGVWRVKGVK